MKKCRYHYHVTVTVLGNVFLQTCYLTCKGNLLRGRNIAEASVISEIAVNQFAGGADREHLAG